MGQLPHIPNRYRKTRFNLPTDIKSRVRVVLSDHGAGASVVGRKVIRQWARLLMDPRAEDCHQRHPAPLHAVLASRGSLEGCVDDVAELQKPMQPLRDLQSRWAKAGEMARLIDQMRDSGRHRQWLAAPSKNSTKDVEAVARSSVDCWGSCLNKHEQMTSHCRRTRRAKWEVRRVQFPDSCQ